MPECTSVLSESKTCGKCGDDKPAAAFPRQGRTCRACLRSYSAEYYRRNREKHIAYAAEYAKRNPPDPGKRRAADRRRIKSSAELCSIAGCGRVLRNLTLRLCNSHYRRVLSTGVMGGAIRERRLTPPGAVCSVVDCNGQYEARGLCRPHYLSQHWREGVKASVRRRRARKLNLPSEPYTVADILTRDGTACVLCGEELDRVAQFPERRSVTVEHLECLSWDGSAGDVLSNVAAAHLGCNNARRAKPHPAAARKRAELLALEVSDREATA